VFQVPLIPEFLRVVLIRDFLVWFWSGYRHEQRARERVSCSIQFPADYITSDANCNFQYKLDIRPAAVLSSLIPLLCSTVSHLWALTVRGSPAQTFTNCSSSVASFYLRPLISPLPYSVVVAIFGKQHSSVPESSLESRVKKCCPLLLSNLNVHNPLPNRVHHLPTTDLLTHIIALHQHHTALTTFTSSNSTP
jgi:hypothetical protein